MTIDGALQQIWRKKGAWQPALVALSALLAYVNTFPGQFIWDDNMVVLHNPLISKFDLVKIFATDYWGSGLSDLYRPLTIMSLALNRWLLGEGAFGFHLINLLLHVGVAVLVWKMLRRWDFPAVVATLAGVLFAVHPIHGEVVNVIVGRSELLAALFLLLGLIVVRDAGRRAGLLTGIFFLLALLSKEHAIVFLPTILLLDLFRRENTDWRELRWSLYGGLFALALAWFCWRTWGIPHLVDTFPVHPDLAPLHAFPVGERVLSAIQVQWLYLGKLLLPITLQGAYSGPKFLEAITFTWALRGILILAGTILSALALWFGWRRKSPVAFLAILYLIAVSPTANLFFPIGTSFAERLMYFPSVWFCAGVATLCSLPVSGRAKGFSGWWLGGGYAVLLLLICLLRNQSYETAEKLWLTDIAREPVNVIAWFNLADVYSHEENREAEAEATFRKLFEMRPDFAPGWRLYANFLYRNEKYGEALVAAKKAGADPNDIQAQLLMAEIYFKLGNYPSSLSWMDQVNPLIKETTRYWDVRGRTLKALGRHAEAVDAFYKVIVVPEGSDLPLELAYSLVYLNRFAEAEPVLNYALAERMGEKAKVLNTLGTVLAQQGRLAEAIAVFEGAVQENPGSQYYRENLDRAREQIKDASPADRKRPNAR